MNIKRIYQTGFDYSSYHNKPGFVYLIHAVGTDRYKIGLTTRAIQYRLKEMNSGQSPYPIELVAVEYTVNASANEKKLHQAFRRYRVHGEWFQFDQSTLKRVIRYYESIGSKQIRQIRRDRSVFWRACSNLIHGFNSLSFQRKILALFAAIALLMIISA